MADGTKIEWTDATLNVVNGCSVISPGCANCYAMRAGGRNLPGHPSTGLTMPSKAGHVWTGEVRLNERALVLPLHWRRPRTIFWNAHGDLFHNDVSDAWIDRCFAVMALTPHHTHQVLTKRSARMQSYCANPWTPQRIARVILDEAAAWGVSGTDALAPCGDRAREQDPSFVHWPLPNVWKGVSVEDQKRADERIPDLLATPAAVRFLSCEPLLGPVDLTNITGAEKSRDYGSPVHGWSAIWQNNGLGRACLDWVIVGGESGPGSRPMHPDWARGLRDQCAAAGVPFLMKQWGDWELALDRERDDPDWRADYTNDYVDRGKSKWLNLEGGCGFHGKRFVVMRSVGKRAAGRLLDGVQHDGMPK
ncbi:phage Gp37/Gp68 family protein [Sphingomonas sp. TREG-RG-20F-R18-01]|uniref:phage Gp37/Gp68 family protein n=1 Tax=Sphingomonas sp. TREG-RG-20F-R18-01 TaxID=2914982 RepID=UPI001F5AF939|nr:phage Gp37/Gp68 family protein [Sphingomonas sp. TREG-RG-20F-R18-01]